MGFAAEKIYRGGRGSRGLRKVKDAIWPAGQGGKYQPSLTCTWEAEEPGLMAGLLCDPQSPLVTSYQASFDSQTLECGRLHVHSAQGSK